MLEASTALLPWLVMMLLVVGLTRQFAVSGRIGMLLDRLTIVPQWKFFGQSNVASDPFCFDDIHLLARRSPNPASPGDWQPLLWWDERRAIEAIWNPHMHSQTALAEALLSLARNEEQPESRLRPTALAYLTVLRLCLDRLPPGEGEAIQFAIVHSRGRDARPLSLRFLSAWHCP